MLYGRLPGYGLSDLGRMMAKAAADDLVARRAPGRRADLVAAAAHAAVGRAGRAAFELEPTLDDRVIEPENRFEGKRMRGPGGALRDIRNWGLLVNPWEPSWGEPFRSVADRMMPAIEDAWSSVDAGDVVIVSHQLPIWMVHRHLAGLSLSHDPRRRRCALSSITTLALQTAPGSAAGRRFVEVGYTNPAVGFAAQATDLGAV